MKFSNINLISFRRSLSAVHTGITSIRSCRTRCAGCAVPVEAWAAAARKVAGSSRRAGSRRRRVLITYLARSARRSNAVVSRIARTQCHIRAAACWAGTSLGRMLAARFAWTALCAIFVKSGVAGADHSVCCAACSAWLARLSRIARITGLTGVANQTIPIQAWAAGACHISDASSRAYSRCNS